MLGNTGTGLLEDLVLGGVAQVGLYLDPSSSVLLFLPLGSSMGDLKRSSLGLPRDRTRGGATTSSSGVTASGTAAGGLGCSVGQSSNGE